MDKYHLFISCAPELETLLLEELNDLGISAVHKGYRGVFVTDWDWSTIYTINYASRLASRVLLPISRFKCFNRQTLYRQAREVNWSEYLKSNMTFAIDANVQHREFRNSLFAAQVLKDAICDQIREKTGRRPSVEIQNPDVQFNLFIQKDVAIISFDTSGEPLHKRGYRQETVEAPIQETLAASILRLSNYTKESVFLDPCCGSGTFLIEAALIASKTPPGYLRKQWGFMRHPHFDQMSWLKVKNQIDAHRTELLPNHLFGVDRSPLAVRAAKINLKAAGFHQAVQVQQGDFREFIPDVQPDFMLTNPPHGNRLENEEQLRPLYRSLGQFMKQSCAKPGRGHIFTSSLVLAKEVGLAAQKRHILSSGGVDSRLLEYEIF